jgi:hypothetical protein
MFITIAGLNVTLLLTSAVSSAYWSMLPRWLRIVLSLLDLSQENNPAVWYSSALLLIARTLAVLCFVVDWSASSAQISRVLTLVSIFCSVVFFALSFDEIGSIHDLIGDFEVMKNQEK